MVLVLLLMVMMMMIRLREGMPMLVQVLVQLQVLHPLHHPSMHPASPLHPFVYAAFQVAVVYLRIPPADIAPDALVGGIKCFHSVRPSALLRVTLALSFPLHMLCPWPPWPPAKPLGWGWLASLLLPGPRAAPAWYAAVSSRSGMRPSPTPSSVCLLMLCGDVLGAIGCEWVTWCSVRGTWRSMRWRRRWRGGVHHERHQQQRHRLCKHH